MTFGRTRSLASSRSKTLVRFLLVQPTHYTLEMGSLAITDVLYVSSPDKTNPDHLHCKVSERERAFFFSNQLPPPTKRVHTPGFPLATAPLASGAPSGFTSS